MNTPRPIISCLHLVNAAILLGLAATACRSWPRLPARVPVHFNFEGVPDRWTEKRPEVLILLFVPWFVSLLLYGIRAAMSYFSRHPEQANLPPRLQSKPAGQLAPLFTNIQDLVLGVATAANIAVGAAAYGTLQVALGRADRMPVWTTWPGLVLVAISLVLGLVRVFGVMGRLSRE